MGPTQEEQENCGILNKLKKKLYKLKVVGIWGNGRRGETGGFLEKV